MNLALSIFGIWLGGCAIIAGMWVAAIYGLPHLRGPDDGEELEGEDDPHNNVLPFGKR